MSPGTDERRLPGQKGGGSSSGSTSSVPHLADNGAEDGLFDVVRTPGHDGRPARASFVVHDEPEDLQRGPGPRPRPTEGGAPDWWQREARAEFLRLAARAEGCTIEDLPAELQLPISASNAARGSLVRSLAAEGRIRLVGYEASRRPSSKGRVLGRWTVAR